MSAELTRPALNREDLLRRFDEWLGMALISEEPPAGVAAEMLAALDPETKEPGSHADLYSLWAAMTALTQEVKLQGRAFQDVSHQLEALPNRERELERETERRCRKEMLNVLIDLEDRLERGMESVRGWTSLQPSWLARTVLRRSKDSAANAVAALRKGYELGMERIEQTLNEFNARRIQCRGELFDPRRMNAIDREENSAAPEGTVLEVYRNGYEWNGEVLRPAQVKVSYKESER